MRLQDTYRVTRSGNPAVQALMPVVNNNADALRELQGLVLEHQILIEALKTELQEVRRAQDSST